MFKSLAELGAGRRYMVPEAAPVHCNDNRPDRRPAAVLKRARPQGLACHWQTEPADETSAEAPGQSCTTRQMQGLLGLALRGKPVIRVAMR
jgi:hypothetical protein